MNVTTIAGYSFLAPYAIVTLPLGLLKQGSVAFDPPLPEAKQQAVDDMASGRCCAVSFLPLLALPQDQAPSCFRGGGWTSLHTPLSSALLPPCCRATGC